ncbi:hypothetical protein [Microbacterium maritypicum]
MSVFHMEKAGEIAGMDPTKKLVLMAICDDASKDTRISYPGLQKLTLWSSRSERRVKELVEDLIRDGHLARRNFAHPGRRAEYIVFPTDDELTALDSVDARLNASRKKPKRPRKSATPPVDNSPGMGATGRTSPVENGGDISQNGGDLGRTPPVSTPKNYLGPVPAESPETQPVDNHRTGPTAPTPRALSVTAGKPFAAADVFASVGHRLPSTFDDAGLELLAAEILSRAKARVLDPTAYVIATIRSWYRPNFTGDDLVDRGEWLIRVDQIDRDRQSIRQTRQDPHHDDLARSF